MELSCNTCKRLLPVSCFHKANTTTRGYQYKCKECVSEDDKTEHRKEYQRKKVSQWRSNNPDKRKLQKERHYAKNKEKIDQRAKDWYNNNRERYRNNAFLRKYGITLEKYNEMREEQKYCCGICSLTEEQVGKKLVVDHNHETGAVRQLLCANCNVGIGFFKDSPNLLEMAASYLRVHNV